MRADVSPFEVIRHTFWLGAKPLETDPRMQRMAECVGAIRPAVERLSRDHGDRRVMWALTAIVVDMALDKGDAEVAAAIFRTNARMLELEAGVDLLGFDP